MSAFFDKALDWVWIGMNTVGIAAVKYRMPVGLRFRALNEHFIKWAIQLTTIRACVCAHAASNSFISSFSCSD